MIKVVAGPVSSGKSKKLIEYYNQLKDCGVAVFSSKFSLAHGEEIISRYGSAIKAIPINNLYDIPHHIGGKYIYHILIDEFQFLRMSLSELRDFFIEYGSKYNFYIFGLNTDYRRVPFKLMANVMAMADEVEFLQGYCDICKKNPSKHSLRLENKTPVHIDQEGELIMLDGEKRDEIDINYLAICDDCWRGVYKDETRKYS